MYRDTVSLQLGGRVARLRVNGRRATLSRPDALLLYQAFRATFGRPSGDVGDGEVRHD